MKTRVALVGLGKMGLMHASILRMLDDVELVAICEKNKVITRFAGKTIPSIKVISDLTQLQGQNLDAVFITTPPASHYQIIKSVYETRLTRNIFVEKPLVASYDQAKSACLLAEKYGGVNMVGYQCRFSRTYQKAKELFDRGDIGKPVSFSGAAFSADFLGGKSAAQTRARGGVVDDLGCHIVDLAVWFLGPMSVLNAGIRSIITPESQDEANITVLTSDRIPGEINCSWCKEGYRLPEIKLTIKGEKGSLTVNEDLVEMKSPEGGNSVWYKHDLNDTSPIFIGGTHYYRQDSLFISSIRNSTAVEPSFKTASVIQKLIDEALAFKAKST